MAAQMAGFARRKYARQKFIRRLFVMATVIVVIAVALVGTNTYLRRKAAPKPTTAAPPLSFESKQAADVHLAGAAVSQYATGNGMLPTQLAVVNNGTGIVLCGATCDPLQYEVTGFSVYQPANIKLVGYAPSLAAPNVATMYLVPGAVCGKDGRLGAKNTNPRSMVILYEGQKADGTTESRCVVL